MAITTERASNNAIVETSAVAAVPISGTESERDLPTVELTHASLTDVEITHHVIPEGDEEEEQAGRSTTVVSTVAEQIPISVRDIDVEGGYSTRVIGNQNGRGEFVSGTFIKANRKVSLGLSLHEDRNEISSIAPGGLVSESPLQVGDRIFSINNKQCSKMNSASIIKMLEGIAGRVTVVAHNEGGSSDIVESMITKTNQRERVGLGVTTSRSRLVVSKVFPGRPVVDSLLNAGDKVISINGVLCENLSAVTAANMIKESPKYVTVVAKTRSDTGVVVAEVSGRNTNTMIASSVPPAQARVLQQRNRRRGTSPSMSDDEIRRRCLMIPIGIIIFVVIAAVVGTQVAEEEDNSYQFSYNDDRWNPNNPVDPAFTNWNDDNTNANVATPSFSWNDDVNNDNTALGSSWGDVIAPTFSWDDDNA